MNNKKEKFDDLELSLKDENMSEEEIKEKVEKLLKKRNEIYKSMGLSIPGDSNQANNESIDNLRHNR